MLGGSELGSGARPFRNRIVAAVAPSPPALGPETSEPDGELVAIGSVVGTHELERRALTIEVETLNEQDRRGEGDR